MWGVFDAYDCRLILKACDRHAESGNQLYAVHVIICAYVVPCQTKINGRPATDH